jgi:hypothetical protein
MSEAKAGSGAAIPSADELRMALLEAEMKKMEEREKLRSVEEKKRADFAAGFLSDHVTDAEKEMIRRVVRSAVKDGKTQAMVYSFPAKLCTDGGRAINNNDKDWPVTLQGKAKELYDGYVEAVKPQGYKLKAMIVSFPGGVPGEVGLFLDWAP